jgi:hypothetical protein
VKEEKEGEREAVAGREPFAVKTGAARGTRRTRRDRLLPLLPLPHRRRAAAAYLLFFLAVPAVPPLFTDALHSGQWPLR